MSAGLLPKIGGPIRFPSERSEIDNELPEKRPPSVILPGGLSGLSGAFGGFDVQEFLSRYGVWIIAAVIVLVLIAFLLRR